MVGEENEISVLTICSCANGDRRGPSWVSVAPFGGILSCKWHPIEHKYHNTNNIGLTSAKVIEKFIEFHQWITQHGIRQKSVTNFRIKTVVVYGFRKEAWH